MPLPRIRVRVSRATPTVRLAAACDLPFVVGLQKADAAALGFLPRQALRDKIRLGQVLLARVAGRRAGFLHHGSLARPEVRVFQVAVTPQNRGRGVARAMVDWLLSRAAAAGARGVSLRCLNYLDANHFWCAAGFRLHATEPGGNGTLNVWVRRIDRGTHCGQSGRGDGFAFSSRVHPCPACGMPTTDTWVRGGRRRTVCAACVAAAPLN